MVSEDTAWSFVSFPVTSTGTHIFKWEYDKDGSWSDGDDLRCRLHCIPPIYTNQTSVMYNNLEMKIFPNPSVGDFTISFNDSKNTTSKLPI